MNLVVPIYSAAFPEIFIISMTCIILLIDVFIPERQRIITYLLSQLTLIGAFILVAMQYTHYVDVITTFSGSYVLDKLAITLKMFIFAVSIFIFLYAWDYIKLHRIARGEYYVLSLMTVLGMSIMVSAGSFLTIYLGLELSSLPLYAMVAMQKDSKNASEAAIKYFVTGTLASGMLLYGFSMLYGATGSIEIPVVFHAITNLAHSQSLVIVLGLVFLMAGLIFKIGAVPFQMWVPDVYHGAPTSVTLFIGSAPKIAAFGIMIRILMETLPSLQVQWTQMLIAIAILSMFLGNILAITQTNIKRMLAYSSIAHMGYMLLGFLTGPVTSTGYSAAMFYIITYIITAMGAFAIIGALSHAGFEAEELMDFRGLNVRNPWLAFIMLLLMFSMAGVPPAVGFFAKVGVLEALIQAHYVWLAVLALLSAIIGAYYYLRVVMLMYFEEPIPALATIPVKLSPNMLVAVSLNGIVILGLGLFPTSIISFCQQAFV